VPQQQSNDYKTVRV